MLGMVGACRDDDVSTASSCLTDQEVLPKLEWAQTVADLGHTAAAPTILILWTCSKRVYMRRDTKIVVWRGEQGRVAAGTGPAKTHPTTPACFERAVRRAEMLVPFARSLLAREARVHAATWADPDIGAASHVDCDADQQPSLASIDTLLHESNHHLQDGGCLHEITTDQPLCFALDEQLPWRSIARISDPVPSLDKNAREALDQQQRLYLDPNNAGPPLHLFDELMAYRITSEVTAARLRIPGEFPTGTYQYNHLPLFMDLSVRYVTELAKRDAALAERTFGAGTQNRAHLLELLDRAELSYTIWRDALEAAHQQPTAYERTFWDAYQRDRQRWTTMSPQQTSNSR